jgi:hypothetical protein
VGLPLRAESASGTVASDNAHANPESFGFTTGYVVLNVYPSFSR